MTEEEIKLVAVSLKQREVDAVIAGNTTLDRDLVKSSPFAEEAGGLSGAPLTGKSTDVIKLLNAELSGVLPIIGVGGIMTGQQAKEKIDAGASLVQIYTGFIYEGPSLIKACVEAINASGS